MVNAYLKEMTEDEYEAHLNDVYGTVNVCGYEHDAGTLLKEVDPIAFRVGLSDCESAQSVYICSNCEAEHDTEEDADECCADEEEEAGEE
jgi:hypothetical protein